VTVVQRGDVDFDGQVDISDLTYLISYLFIGGPPPQPIQLSGEMDCADPVDISDLTALIGNLFISLAPSPCNPY